MYLYISIYLPISVRTCMHVCMNIYIYIYKNLAVHNKAKSRIYELRALETKGRDEIAIKIFSWLPFQKNIFYRYSTE